MLFGPFSLSSLGFSSCIYVGTLDGVPQVSEPLIYLSQRICCFLKFSYLSQLKKNSCNSLFNFRILKKLVLTIFANVLMTYMGEWIFGGAVLHNSTNVSSIDNDVVFIGSHMWIDSGHPQTSTIAGYGWWSWYGWYILLTQQQLGPWIIERHWIGSCAAAKVLL